MARAARKSASKRVSPPAASPQERLTRYREKRDFTQTAEPAGVKTRSGPRSDKRGFVVQKHAATRLHYDFRLELDGTLKSWAVTRGPSANPDDKRLSVRTEDHPLDYARFEGTIPKGQYGGGTVMLWDNGWWEPVGGKDPSKTLEEGHLHFILHGRRMKGEWLMVRLRPRGKEKGENWLLRKIDDAHAAGSDDLVMTHQTSIATGLTLEEIAAGRPAAKGRHGTKQAGDKHSPQDSRPATRPPPFQPVQLATLVDVVPSGDRWLHELKYDGYRTLLAIGTGEGRAYTRSGLDWSDKFAGLIDEGLGLDCRSALIDGEAVVVGADGRTSFQALQAALKHDPDAIRFYAFDLLAIDGEDLTRLALIDRKARLEALLSRNAARHPRLLYSDHIVGQGEALLGRFCEAGLEGVISKRADARYVGSRVGTWLKTKCIRRQEFVILGWTPSSKQRGFRSLLLGVHEDGKLVYAGKVGTGFTADEIERLMSLMEKLRVSKPPVVAPRAAVRGARWIEPRLVCEVAFIEVTEEGVLRHPSYLGLREDKKAGAVLLEHETPVASAAARGAGARVAISNSDRVIFPEANITKGALADHYAAVADIMLPWVGNRPISLVRCPQGRSRKCFFQKHDAGTFGGHIKHVGIAEKDGHEEPYLFIDDAEGLLACVQMGTIEFHGWGARIEDVEKADRLVFDLDPDEGLGFEAVRSAAFEFRDLLAQIGLETFAMVTGGKGVHVIAPLTPQAEWPEVKDFARRFAQAVAQASPERFTAALPKAQRKGRIFVDYLRNQRGATAVMPYAVRAREGAPVAVPLSWKELETIDGPAHWYVGDAAALVRRARSSALTGWGRADQVLPDL
ncbi:DNA ligase D [Sphingomonas crocodyli]|uniref:DNA ligase (ATP) n=1 Tax=Sphingomonas crocodyli TaxID=1979270 RepID=A0A437LYB6_9SPHN|nr:DNA ligase D [Sphingomonas crocodyli]RVT90377.1 DNA ligase D [Sphingomonas crocodyli]